MKYVVRIIAGVVVLGALSLVAFAYVGDLSPVQSQVEQPVKLNAD